MELTVKFIFSEDWDNGCKNIDAELIAEDAIRELAAGVGYEIISFKRGEAASSNQAHDVVCSCYMCGKTIEQPAEQFDMHGEMVCQDCWDYNMYQALQDGGGM